MRFSRMILEFWRNFKKVDVELQERVFIIGPNASGKSNFLDAFRFLRDLTKVGGGFQAAVQSRGGISKIRSLAARQKPSVTIGCEFVDYDGHTWLYKLKFGSPNNRLVIEEETVLKNGDQIIHRSKNSGEEDEYSLQQTHLEQASTNNKFREVVDFFGSVNYLHLVPQLIREQEKIKRDYGDPFGSDFLEHIWRTPEKKREKWLKTIEKAIKCAIPQFSDLMINKDSNGIPHLQAKYIHWRPRGAMQNESDFSDGTIRLLGLGWALLDNKGPLLLEEPELSLHPGIVRNLTQMIESIRSTNDRQIIVSTHSQEMLRDEGIGYEEVLLLFPGKEGTEVRQGGDDQSIKAAMDAGLTAADTVFAITEPKEAKNLSNLS